MIRLEGAPSRAAPGSQTLQSTRVARQCSSAVALGSRTLEPGAAQTSLAYLAAIALTGLGLNTVLWADPLAALPMVPIVAREGLEGACREHGCDVHC